MYRPENCNMPVYYGYGTQGGIHALLSHVPKFHGLPFPWLSEWEGKPKSEMERQVDLIIPTIEARDDYEERMQKNSNFKDEFKDEFRKEALDIWERLIAPVIWGRELHFTTNKRTIRCGSQELEVII